MLETVVSAALDDEHKNQAVAQKLVMDRLLPISTFEKKFDNRESITIRVSITDKAPEALKARSLSNAQKIPRTASR